MVCAPRAYCGLSRMGFMSAVGDTPQARAWSAWARPISPPSRVTAALFDLFCGLKGRTVNPRRVKARASPATSSDLPTSEDRKSVVSGKRVSVRVDLGGRRILQKKKHKK